MPAKLCNLRQLSFPGFFAAWTGHRAVTQSRGTPPSEVNSNGRQFNISIHVQLSAFDAGRNFYLRRVAKRPAAYRIDRAVPRPRRFQRAAQAIPRTGSTWTTPP